GLECRVADRDLIRREPERRSWPRAFVSAHSLPILVAWVLGEHAGRTARRSAHDTTLWPHVRRRRWAGGLARGPILGGCARLGPPATAVRYRGCSRSSPCSGRSPPSPARPARQPRRPRARRRRSPQASRRPSYPTVSPSSSRRSGTRRSSASASGTASDRATSTLG